MTVQLIAYHWPNVSARTGQRNARFRPIAQDYGTERRGEGRAAGGQRWQCGLPGAWQRRVRRRPPRGDWAGKPRGGKVRAARLTTGEIHADGGIPPNTPDLISGAVFVVYSGEVSEVLNEGPVTAYGPNDMVLDNWGTAVDPNGQPDGTPRT
jgi:hypothetical protein